MPPFSLAKFANRPSCNPYGHFVGHANDGHKTAYSASRADLGQICCKSVWAVHIFPLFWSIEQLLIGKIDKIYPCPVEF